MKGIIAYVNLFMITTCLLVPGRSVNAENWFKRGLFFLESRQYDDAIKAFSASIEVLPHDFESYCHRGTAWLYKGEYERSVADFTKALDINPKYANAYCNRGTAWFYKGAYDQAIADFTKALNLNPYYYEAYNNRGTAWFYKGAYERGIEDCKKAIAINPRYSEAYHQLALILAVCPDSKYRNPNKAVAMARKAVEFNPIPDFMDTLAAAYAGAGNFEDAIATQKSVIALLKQEGRTDLTEYIEHLKRYEASKPLGGRYGDQEQNKNKDGVKGTGSRVKGEEADSLTQTSYPYTIQVSSYRDKERSNQVAMKLRKKGDHAFTSPAHIRGKGNWFRVFVGYFRNLEEVKKAAFKLKKRNFRYANVVKKPYTILVGLSGSEKELEKLETDLRSKGYVAYRIPDSRDGGKIRLLIGAFNTEKEATRFIQKLHDEGFNPRVVQR